MNKYYRAGLYTDVTKVTGPKFNIVIIARNKKLVKC